MIVYKIRSGENAFVEIPYSHKCSYNYFMISTSFYFRASNSQSAPSESNTRGGLMCFLFVTFICCKPESLDVSFTHLSSLPHRQLWGGVVVRFFCSLVSFVCCVQESLEVNSCVSVPCRIEETNSL